MIQYFQWMPFVEKMDSVDGVDGELAIFTYSDFCRECKQKEYEVNDAMMRTPHKLDFLLIINQFAGSVTMNVNMEKYRVTGGANMLHVMPGQIVSLEHISPDFDAYVMIMSSRFVESLLVYMNNSVPFRINADRMSAVKPLTESENKMSEFFVKAVRYVLADKENPYRLQAERHVMMAIFYSSDKLVEMNNNGEILRTNVDVLSKQFMELVKENFRKERQLKFYADALCITPRYLSRVVKECTGSSAADWIERYVVLEARALLKSTTMNIQQISDSLNFPSQTFFGKYFKRRVGMSPKEYRRVG